MTVHDLIAELKERLKQADQAQEPQSWDINLSKADLRMLIAAVELDEEHRHLLATTHALG